MSEARLGMQDTETGQSEQDLKEKIFQAADMLFQNEQVIDLSHVMEQVPSLDARAALPHLQFWRLQKALSVAQKGGIVKALVDSLAGLSDDVDYIIDQKMTIRTAEIQAVSDAEIGKLQAKVSAQEAIVADARERADKSESNLQEQQESMVMLEEKLDSARYVGSELVEKVDLLEAEKEAAEQRYEKLHNLKGQLEDEMQALQSDLQNMRYSLDTAAEQASQSAERIDNLEKELLEQQKLREIAQEETVNMGQRMRLEGGWLLEDGVALSNDVTRQLAVSTMRIVELKAERDQLAERVKDMRSVVDKTHEIMEKQAELPQMFTTAPQPAPGLQAPANVKPAGQQMLPSAVQSFTENIEEGPQIEIIR